MHEKKLKSIFDNITDKEFEEILKECGFKYKKVEPGKGKLIINKNEYDGGRVCIKKMPFKNKSYKIKKLSKFIYLRLKKKRRRRRLIEMSEIDLLNQDNSKSQSKYTYQNSKVLKNKLDIKEFDAFTRAEKVFTAVRIAELQQKPIQGNFDIKHLCKIHKYIFQDIYEWAGKTRDVEINKSGTQFAPSRYMVDGLKESVFEPLKKNKYLKNLNFNETIQKLAQYYTELNFAHPFREGNGRTQREFIRCLAAKNGYKIEWNKIDQDKLLKATVEATKDFNYEGLIKLLSEAIINMEPDKKLIKEISRRIEINR